MMKNFLKTIVMVAVLAVAAAPMSACGDETPLSDGSQQTTPPATDDNNGDNDNNADGGGSPENPENPENPDSPDVPEDKPNEDNDMYTKMTITVGGRTFVADLADTEAAQAFAARLPLTLAMNELNGNEKYADLDFTLPTATFRPGTIYEGDILLWGSDCAVLFYKTFASSYSYTRIGRIADTAGLREAVGTGDVTVRFERE